MCAIYAHMKKIFEHRVRLVVYLEAADLAKFSERARRAGKQAPELARELILGTTGDEAGPKISAPELGLRGNLPRTFSDKKKQAEEAINNFGRSKMCKHGTRKGYRCWQCGGKAVVE